MKTKLWSHNLTEFFQRFRHDQFPIQIIHAQPFYTVFIYFLILHIYEKTINLWAESLLLQT